MSESKESQSETSVTPEAEDALKEKLRTLERGEKPGKVARELREFIRPREGEGKEATHAREVEIDRAIDAHVNDVELKAIIYRFLWLYKEPNGFGMSSHLENLLRDGHEEFLNTIAEHQEKTSPTLIKHALIQIVENDPERMLYDYKKYKDLPCAQEVVIQAAFRLAETNASASAFQFVPGKYIEGVPHSEQRKILEMIINKDPRPVAKDLYPYINFEFKDRDDLKPMLNEARHIYNLDQEIAKNMTFEDRVEKINGDMTNINAELIPRAGKSALDQFNTETGMSMQCMGIRSNVKSYVSELKYFELDFINTFGGSNKLPCRICLTYGEVRNAKTHEDVLRLLRSKYKEQMALHKDQYEVWEKSKSFDLPKNNRTAVMLALVPKHLRGIESDFVRMAEIYLEEYEAHIVSVSVEEEEKWNDAVKENNNDLNLPNVAAATTEHLFGDPSMKIEGELSKQLKKAIDNEMETFVFHSMFHGDDDGTFETVDRSDTSAKRIAEICAEEYNGKSIAEQISIVVLKESCLSESQVDTELLYFNQKKTPIKDYVSIASSGKNTSSTAGFMTINAGLKSEEMRNSEFYGDNSALFTYYFSYYYELLDYKRSIGEKTEPPFGTFSHAIQFADRMSREASAEIAGEEGQNPVGRRYSTEQELGDYFTKLQNNMKNEQLS